MHGHLRHHPRTNRTSNVICIEQKFLLDRLDHGFSRTGTGTFVSCPRKQYKRPYYSSTTAKAQTSNPSSQYSTGVRIKSQSIARISSRSLPARLYNAPRRPRVSRNSSSTNEMLIPPWIHAPQGTPSASLRYEYYVLRPGKQTKGWLQSFLWGKMAVEQQRTRQLLIVLIQIPPSI